MLISVCGFFLIVANGAVIAIHVPVKEREDESILSPTVFIVSPARSASLFVTHMRHSSSANLNSFCIQHLPVVATFITHMI